MAEKILVADDQEEMREAIKGALSLADYEALLAQNGQVCFDLYKASLEANEPIPVILLDVEMPVLNGVRTLEKLRELEKEKHIEPDKRVQVIMLTAQRDSFFPCIDFGCNDYILKPFDIDILHEKVAHALKVYRKT